MISICSRGWTIDNIKTVIFDKDGTFIDLHSFWGKITELRVLQIIKRYNLSYDHLNDLCLFLGYDLQIKRMLADGITAIYSRSVIIDKLSDKLKEFELSLKKSEIENIFDNVTKDFNKNMFEYIKPIESAVNFIKELHSNGIQLGVVTSDSVETTDLTLKHFGLDKLFDVVIGRESSEYTKESGVPTNIALSQMNANPETTLMIGDTSSDYISARKANVKNVILVASGQVPVNELKILTPYAVDTLDDLTCRQNTYYH